MLMELKDYSILLYNMFRKAQMDFEEEGYLKLSLEDTMVVRDKATGTGADSGESLHRALQCANGL